MNLLINPSSEKPEIIDNSIDQLIGELSDPNSVWHDLKIAEMAGFDYVFAPDAVCHQLSTLNALSAFFNNVGTILGSDRSRTVLVSYWHDRYRELHFEKFSLQWADEIAIAWDKSLLDNSPQLDYIKTIYGYSEKLIVGHA